MRDTVIVPFSFSCLLQMMDLLVFGDVSIALRDCRVNVKGRRIEVKGLERCLYFSATTSLHQGISHQPNTNLKQISRYPKNSQAVKLF